jgi:serine/threonine protein kinase
MPAATLLRSGDVIGGFRIDDVIGIGGMAIVYRAEQVSLGRPVALKVLSSKLTSDEVFRERFRREGKHAAILEHPNIVPVYDSGEQDGLLYLAMRLVEGTNLAELVQTRGVTADQTIELLRPIASALDTAHAAGLIHRDVKPQNILITSQAHPYLADFGVAKGSNTHGLTATGGFVGSVNYASPEQINGLTLTPASDVYALTAVLYQCLTGQVPYPRDTDAGVMHAHLNDPPPTLPSVEGADSDFHTVLARGMAKDPGSRYGHAGDMLTAAALCVGRLPSKMRSSVPAFAHAAPDTARSIPPNDLGTSAGSADAVAPPGLGDERPSPPAGSAPGDSAVCGQTPHGSMPPQVDPTELVAPSEMEARRQGGGATQADLIRRAAPQAPQGPLTHRRRLMSGALAISAIVAVVVGIVLAAGGTTRHAKATAPVRRIGATTSAALISQQRSEAAAKVTSVLQPTALERERGLAKMNAADTRTVRAHAAREVGHAYERASRQISKLGISTRLLPSTRELPAALKAHSAAYYLAGESLITNQRGVYASQRRHVPELEWRLQPKITDLRLLLTPSQRSQAGAYAALGFRRLTMPQALPRTRHNQPRPHNHPPPVAPMPSRSEVPTRGYTPSAPERAKPHEGPPPASPKREPQPKEHTIEVQE